MNVLGDVEARPGQRPLLPLAVPLAVADAVEALAPVRCEVKWPNDVWIEGRKVAGVLIEGKPGEWAIVGVGLNVAVNEFPDELLREDFPLDVLQGSLHAAEHGQIAVLPLIAMCDRWDIGGLSTNVHFQTGRSTIFIYDGHPGGVGIAQRGNEQFERLLGDAFRLIEECPCESGCPSCVQSPKCGNLNEPLHKAGALELMGLMRGRR